MELINTIKTRQSIRKFTEQKVADNDIKILLEAAMNAPTAVNCQCWRFILLDDYNIFQKIAKFHKTSTDFNDVKQAILVCADLNQEKIAGFWPQDCAAATQNILLTAHAQGLGAVWTGIYPLEEKVKNVKQIMDLPENIMPFSIIPFGYSAETKKREDRFDLKKVYKNSLENNF